jgi:hypothetical protein
MSLALPQEQPEEGKAGKKRAVYFHTRSLIRHATFWTHYECSALCLHKVVFSLGFSLQPGSVYLESKSFQ